MLFSEKHFTNQLGDLLSKRASTAKLEKFFSTKVKEKLKEISLDLKIEASFSSLQDKI